MLTLLPTPIGNLKDITYRTVEEFGRADLILCEDTRVTKKLLRLLGERMESLPPFEADFLSFNEHNGPQRLEEIGDRLAEERVVYASDAGMPAISDPGRLLVAYCQERKIDYDVLPGASAVTTAYAASGFETGRFLFYGFLPHKSRLRAETLGMLMKRPEDLILYEAPHRLLRLLEEIRSIDPDRGVFAAKELSKQHQRYYFGETAGELLQRLQSGPIRGEWVVVIRGERSRDPVLRLEEVLAMSLPPKIKAKLLSKMTGDPVARWYERLGGAGK